MNQMNETNTSKLGGFIANAMDMLDDGHDDIDIGTMMLICEFSGEREDGAPYTRIKTICSDGREFVQLGMLRSATLAAERHKRRK